MEVARQKQVAAKKPHGTGSQQNKVSRGKAKMNAAADRMLEKNRESIAKTLLKKTLEGNMTSAKLLFALAEGQFDCEDATTVKHLLSLAEKLASEPQCSEEMIDAKSKNDSE